MIMTPLGQMVLLKIKSNGNTKYIKPIQTMAIKTVTISNYKKQQACSLNWLVDVRKNIKITWPSS